ncbi:CLUMA_CG020948, isoform A [Clunio marinus]|uniref:CLUMA_CG020948, isoform A n=1 Tax=Clunio marinus TaxID=568069 RepID=A0A1J1J6P5_9DIPT|nr:CLUMA_CG020948, isoform A [Clunio marinus]
MYLEITNLFLFCLISLVVGAVIMLIVQYYIFVRFFKTNNNEEQPAQDPCDGTKITKFNLPQSLLESFSSLTDDSKTEIKSVNLVLQFLFFELRSSNLVRKWFLRKLSMELDELLTKTTIGKFFSKLSISGLDLGNQFPEIQNLKLSKAELHPEEGFIEKLDILMNIQYRGDFQLKIDADMVLGKKGSLSMKVKQLSGKARLQFTRQPFTHWSISFIHEPLVELEIESKIQGRQMQPHITSLISSAVKKAIRRKHTLPNYKLRFKPFFNRLIYDEIDLPMEVTGRFEITLLKLTRLSHPSNVTHSYVTLTLSPYSFITLQQVNEESLVISLDIDVHKAKNQQIGIIFKQTELQVVIENILPNTPAAVAEIKRGDILISIEGRKFNHINQVAKFLKSLNKSIICFRLERVVAGFIKNDAIIEDMEDVYEDFNNMNITFSKNLDAVQIGNESKEEGTITAETNVSTTPLSSPKKTSSRVSSNYGSPKKQNLYFESFGTSCNFQQHITLEKEISNFVYFNDSTSFILNPSCLYLNVSVFGRTSSQDSLLLGFINIPVDNVLAECSESNLNYVEKFMLNPPEIPKISEHPLSTQSGFCSSICYGDASIEFSWNQETNNDQIQEKESKMFTQTFQNKLNIESETNRKHKFVRTHFNRSTQCDFCGKKIWLKDAVQCEDCLMSCHKKCMVKSQNSTICSGLSEGKENESQTIQPEVRITTTAIEGEDFELADEAVDNYKLSGHRQSFSDLVSQGIKRVNSANNLNISTIVSSLAQNSKSLPPTPQHTPRKLSLVTQSNNPFANVVYKLEQLSSDIKIMDSYEIKNIVEPLQGWGTLDDLMELAKTSSELLYVEHCNEERINKINLLLSKLRIALDCETSYQHDRKGTSKSNEADNISYGREKAEETIQLLSVIMLHLCSGLQSAQNIM